MKTKHCKGIIDLLCFPCLLRVTGASYWGQRLGSPTSGANETIYLASSLAGDRAAKAVLNRTCWCEQSELVKEPLDGE